MICSTSYGTKGMLPMLMSDDKVKFRDFCVVPWFSKLYFRMQIMNIKKSRIPRIQQSISTIGKQEWKIKLLTKEIL